MWTAVSDEAQQQSLLPYDESMQTPSLCQKKTLVRMGVEVPQEPDEWGNTTLWHAAQSLLAQLGVSKSAMATIANEELGTSYLLVFEVLMLIVLVFGTLAFCGWYSRQSATAEGSASGVAHASTRRTQASAPLAVSKLPTTRPRQSAASASKTTTIEHHDFQDGRLSITVLGASGDLAKKKTYPSLLNLYTHGFFPKGVSIVGYARSKCTTEEFRAKLRPWLLKVEKDEKAVDAFLQVNTYFQGNYGSVEDFARLSTHLAEQESTSKGDSSKTHRLFYFAIPPDAFLDSAKSIKASSMSSTGFTRLIVEKPFGHDLESATNLVMDLESVFTEDHIYRIDHYLGKEIVQNLIMFRFGNNWLEPLMNNKHVANVRIIFKEDFGTEGRGGYFTNYGIVRDVIQNHLMQVFTLVAMEPPPKVTGPEAGNMIRDAKNRVLQSVAPIDPDRVVLGQYVAANGKPGYLEDDSIKEAGLLDKAKTVPTYAQVFLDVQTPRWAGVPFILKAAKATNERKAEIRIQFKDAPAGTYMFGGDPCARNELVMQLQPHELVYMKVNVKTPGLEFKPTVSELDLTYENRYKDVYNPDAYTRLILEALRGNQENFVRSDELLESWRLYSPLLEQLETRVPLPYEYGSRGPAEADAMLETKGNFTHDVKYVWAGPPAA